MKKLIGLIFFTLFILSAQADFINKIPANQLEKKRIDFINNKIETLKKVSSIKQLEEINSLFNVFISYASDKEVYGKNDYIAVVEETVTKGNMKGDCDDYTMAKAQAISYLGFREQYVLYSTEKGIRHVKNVVKVNNVYYVLDNLNKKFRVLMSSELNQAGNKIFSAEIYLMLAKERLAKLK